MKALISTIACALLSTLIADVNMECCMEPDPCCGVSYELYGDILILQPNGSHFYYGAEAIGIDPNIPLGVLSPNWNILEINPDYHLGFEVGASVLFKNSNINVELNWERVNSNDKDTFVAADVTGDMVGPLFDIGPNSSAYQVATGKVTSRFDEARLNFGKKFSFCDRLYTNFYAGVDFARIKQTMSSTFSNFADTVSRTISGTSTFTGGGPDVGINYDYRMFDHFFFTGNSAFSLFMGQLKNNNTFTSFSPFVASVGNPVPNIQKTYVKNRAQLVPGFEQKLGFSYQMIWDSVSLNLEIGYQCQVYINAIQTVDMASGQAVPTDIGVIPADEIPGTGVYALGFARTLSNYILTGPYASLALDF